MGFNNKALTCVFKTLSEILPVTHIKHNAEMPYRDLIAVNAVRRR